MSNYPPGTGPNDPKAPWNEPEPVMETCERCGGKGYTIFTFNNGETEEDECEPCHGTGQVEIEVEE